ncbi:MAG: signal peptide peptidase SppA [Endomicrobia bacterium]|nr:signal peptide peptidase SppA [Endomicrobiia bacterium]
MKNNVNIIIMILFIISVILGFAIIIQRRIDIEKMPIKHKKDKIAIIDLRGEIFYADVPRAMLKKDVEYYVEKLSSLFQRSDVKGIVLKINSPGGSVAAVQRLYNQIIKMKQQYKKPIVCYVPELCASGGYYVAVACDKIICAEGSVVGSIGVLLQVGNINGLLKKIGVNVEIIKSSKYKDMGSPFRDMLPEEKKMFQDLVNAAYEQFIAAIEKGRNLDRQDILKFADGGIYIANKAFELKMVDGVGDENVAIDEVKKITKIEEVEILREKTSFIDVLRQAIEERQQKISGMTKFIRQKFAFEYMLE